MKTKSTLFYLWSFIFVLALCPAPLTLSQIPQGFNYQAIARDAGGAVLPNTPLQVMFYIQSSSSGGTIFWKEFHSSVNTNAFGLFNLVVGTGTRQSESTVASFDLIDWSVSPKYLKTDIYYSGSWKYFDGTQIYAVPYAMTARTLTGASKLGISGTTSNLEEALFEVKNKDGQTVFAVYNEGVRIYVSNGAKAVKGGFAVGGFGTDKAETTKYLFVGKDSVRIYLDTNPVTKGKKSGFAVGGYDLTKGTAQTYLDVNADSTRIYVDNNPAKGVKGGFAVGGFDATKGVPTPFTSLTPKNYFIGHEGGQKITSGQYNSAVGYQSGKFITTGESNAFLGYQSGYNNNTGTGNLFLGYQTGYSTTGGNYNSFVGYTSGYSNTSGLYNSFLGSFAGNKNTTGSYNTFVGDSAGYSNLGGSRNSFYGNKAGLNNSSGSDNIFFGNQAGLLNTTGNYNIFIGYKAGYTNSSSYNVFLGFESGFSNSTGNPNVFIGYQAGRANNTGANNIFIGNQAGIKNTTGYDNVYIGNNVGAGVTGTEAYSNVFIGNYCGNEITYGLRNVYIGNLSGRKTSNGQDNVFIGHAAGELNTSGYANVFIGPYAGQNSNGLCNVMLGVSAGTSNSSGGNNVFLGYHAGYTNSTGGHNIFIGSQAGYNNSVGAGNICIGHYAGFNETGSNKLYIDNSSVPTPLIYGDFDARYITINGAFTTTGNASINKTWIADNNISINAGNTGDRDAFIDFNTNDFYSDFGLRITRYPGTNGQSIIFHRGTGQLLLLTQEAAPIVFATGSTEKFRVEPNGNIGINNWAPGQKLDISGGNGRVQSGYSWLTNSDVRYKKNITELEGSLEKVLKIRGVRYDLTEDKTVTPGNGKYIGFIAQELEAEYPEFVVTDPDGYKSVGYDKITAVLTEAIKEQQNIIVNQQKQIDELKEVVEKLVSNK